MNIVGRIDSYPKVVARQDADDGHRYQDDGRHGVPAGLLSRCYPLSRQHPSQVHPEQPDTQRKPGHHGHVARIKEQEHLWLERPEGLCDDPDSSQPDLHTD